MANQFQAELEQKITWMSQFQNGSELPVGYETSLYLPGRRGPLAVTITSVDEENYRVDLTTKSAFAIGAQAWRISRESAVKNPGATLFILKPASVESVHE